VKNLVSQDKLKVKLFADGADLQGMLKLAGNPNIKGFTTNPTLMKRAGVQNYEAFAREVLSHIQDRPISFEVFADEFDVMYQQALKIHTWGTNVNVKIPIMNTKRQYSYELITKLSEMGVNLNVTAIFTLEQVRKTVSALVPSPATNHIISVFAGRIADTGVDPVPLMQEALTYLEGREDIELLWASPREFLNIIQADQIGCHIITATPGILEKISLLNKDLEEFSLETVKMFYNDASAAGFEITGTHTVPQRSYENTAVL
jgi:transaldolase